MNQFFAKTSRGLVDMMTKAKHHRDKAGHHLLNPCFCADPDLRGLFKNLQVTPAGVEQTETSRVLMEGKDYFGRRGNPGFETKAHRRSSSFG
jgi:hypothetical protein